MLCYNAVYSKKSKLILKKYQQNIAWLDPIEYLHISQRINLVGI